MKQWQLTGFGPDRLELAESRVPQPGPHQILVRVAAASLNYRDKRVVEGKFFPDLHFPFVPASDAAGTVAAVGEGVTRCQVGDRVTTHFYTRWLDGAVPSAAQAASSLGGPLPGVLSEFMLLDEEAAVATPAYLSDAEASTLPIAALTAWWALFATQPLLPGQTVLVQGTGGVSLFAVQLAVAAGARVIVTSGSDEKLARAGQLGAADIINYTRQPAWDQEVLVLTGGRGADHVLEVAGGENLRCSQRAMARGGQIALIGFLADDQLEMDIIPFMLKYGTLHTVGVGHRRAFEEMNRALAAAEIHPVVDRVYPFAEAPAAFAHLERGPFGKVVVEVG